MTEESLEILYNRRLITSEAAAKETVKPIWNFEARYEGRKFSTSSKRKEI